MSIEHYIWQIDRGPRVVLVERDGYGVIVLTDRGKQIEVRPSHAAQIASAIDECLRRVDRTGRVRRDAQ